MTAAATCIGVTSHEEAIRATDEKWALLVEARDSLRKEFSRLHERRVRLEQDLQSLTEQNGGSQVRPTDKLKLNVGGTRMVIRRETFLQFPETHLAALFSGRWENRLLRDRRGRVFLDVNPTCFRTMLDFLCTYKLASPDDPLDPPDVPEELQGPFDALADFFGMREVFRPPSTLDTTISLTPQQSAALEAWVVEAMAHGKPAPCRLELLYRASRDGWDPQQFHRRCDAQGPTVTLIKTDHGYVFGGFSDQSWTSGGHWIASQKAFLFALCCAAGLGPTRLPVANADHALYGHSSYLPAFGGGFDLKVGTNKRRAGDVRVGHSYECPRGLDGSAFLTGAGRFQASEVEVFAVSCACGVPRPRPPPDRIPSHPRTGGCGNEESAFESVAGYVGAALRREQQTLREAVDAQSELERRFAEERRVAEFFTGGEARDIVDIDVVGERISSRRSTLMLCADSPFARHFDAVWGRDAAAAGDDADSDDDSLLMEHSAYCFGKIVDQLRLRAMLPSYAHVPAPVVAPREQRNFERLLQFYFPGHEEFVYGVPRTFMASQVLSLQQISQLCGLLPFPAPDVALLYRATRDGWEPQRFHSACDGQGPTFTLVKAAGEYVFGAFADQSWGSQGRWIASPKAFLFSLRSAAGLGPIRLPVINPAHALWGDPASLPTFGGGHDLCVGRHSGSAKLGCSYACPPGHDGSSLLTGATNFEVCELEVFGMAQAVGR